MSKAVQKTEPEEDVVEICISDIEIGDRVRRDMGDIDGLASSIKALGLLHPVVVTKDHVLVAGRRRIEAARKLGWKRVPVTVVNVEDLLVAERDENEERKDFTPTEAVALGRLIEERERPKALERKREGGRKGGQASVKGSEPLGREPTREVVGRAVGMSGVTYQRAKAVVTATESEPGRFGDLAEQMDETRNVLGAYNEMKRRKSGAVPEKLTNPNLFKNTKKDWKPQVSRAIDTLESMTELLRTHAPRLKAANGEAFEWSERLRKHRTEITRLIAACEEK